MFYLRPNLSSLLIASQPPWRSGQIFGGAIGIKWSGNGDRSEAVATLGNHASIHVISAGGECVGGGRWEWGKKVLQADTSCES